MKQLILPFLLAILALYSSTTAANALPSQAAAADKPPIKLIYDFKAKTLGVLKAGETNLSPLPDLFQANDKFTVQVINVNRYLYQVGVTVNSEEFKSKPPALLAGLFSPGAELATALAPFGALLGGAAVAAVLPNKTPGAKPALSPIETVVNKFTDLVDREKNIPVEELRTFDSHTLNTNQIVDPTFANISAELTANLQACAEFEKVYYDALKAAGNDALIKALQDIKQVYDKRDFAERFRDYAKFRLNLTQDNFQFITRELTADADLMHIGIKIQPRDSKDTSFFIPLQTDSLNFDIPVSQNKGRLSFSQGLFISGLVNDEYAYKANLDPATDTATSYQLVSEKPKKLRFGVVAMAHYTWGDKNNKIRGGFHLGAGIPIDRQLNGQLFLGVTVAVPLGSGTNKLFFNLSETAGLVKRISDTYQPNQKFAKDDKAIIYTQTMNLSTAFSVTFNFF